MWPKVKAFFFCAPEITAPPVTEFQCLKNIRPQMYLKAVPEAVDVPVFCCRCFLLDLLASWCCVRVTSDMNSPLQRACRHRGRSWAKFSQLEGAMPKHLRSFLQTSLKRSWGRPICLLPDKSPSRFVHHPSGGHGLAIGDDTVSVENTSWKI